MRAPFSDVTSVVECSSGSAGDVGEAAGLITASGLQQQQQPQPRRPDWWTGHAYRTPVRRQSLEWPTGPIASGLTPTRRCRRRLGCCFRCCRRCCCCCCTVPSSHISDAVCAMLPTRSSSGSLNVRLQLNWACLVVASSTMLCISAAYAVVRCLSVTFVCCVETATATAIVAMECE